MLVPFQAIECYLANVIPLKGLLLWLSTCDWGYLLLWCNKSNIVAYLLYRNGELKASFMVSL